MQPHEKIVEDTVNQVSKAINAATEALHIQHPDMSLNDCRWTVTELMTDRLVYNLHRWDKAS